METQIEQTTIMNPAKLLELAISKDADLTKLEKLMDLQERWEKNEARKSFLESLSKFQNVCPALEKSKQVDFALKTGGRTQYKYTPLGEIAATIKNAMFETGLSHRWEIEEKENKLIVTCVISHKNGHSEKTTMSAGLDSSGSKNDIQQRGSSITYLQRYTLIAALGISTADEDDDGKIGGLEELIGKLAKVNSKDELEMLWESLSSAEKKVPDIINLFKINKWNQR